MKHALISEITGQDGPCLVEFRLYKGYEIHRGIWTTSTFNRERIDRLYHNPRLPLFSYFPPSVNAAHEADRSDVRPGCSPLDSRGTLSHCMNSRTGNGIHDVVMKPRGMSKDPKAECRHYAAIMNDDCAAVCTLGGEREQLWT